MSRFAKKPISPRSSKAKLSIEQTIGTTSRHNSCIAVNSLSGEVAYASGCVVVLFNPLIEDSQRYLSGSKPKSISCLAFSQNGKFLAVGESGYQPSVLIFDVASGKLLVELMGHRCGVSCVQFDPSCKYLISVGFIEDKFINVWEWREKQTLAINKVANKIYSLDFGEDGTYFVTSGVKHLKIWYLTDTIGGPIKKTEKTYKGRAVLEGKMIALGEKQECTFMDVVCSQGDGQYIFAVTEDGFLIQVDRILGQIGKWVNMKAESAFGLSATQNYISVACTDGISRVFNPENLQYISTLPKPAATGYEVSANISENQADRVYPNVIGIKFIKEDLILCLYSNRSIVLWDIQDFSKVEILYSFLAHSACIWDLVTTSNGTFITASADKTIKFWNLESKIQKTPFSKELVKSLSICENYSELKMDNQAGSETSFLGEEGIRCLAVSPDERHLASGDRTGNLRIHEIDTYECISILPAHDTEILSLAYSCPSVDGPKLLASGSRDRLVHIFQRSEGYDPYSLMATLDDHTSTVTSVKFAEEKGSTKLISTSTDKSILFRKISDSGKIDIYHRELTGLPIYDIEIDPRETSLIAVGAETKISSWDVAGGKKTKSIAVTDADSVKGKLLKVDIDPSGQFVVTSSQDRFIRLYDLSSGQMISKVTGHSELITGLRFTKDCSRIISVSGDGCIFVWRLSSDLTNIMQKKLAEIQDQIPRFTALSLAKSQKLNRFTFDHSRLPMWAQRSFLPKNSELLVTRIAEPKFRGAWTVHLDSIPLVHNALLQLSPKTVSNKVGSADLFTHRSLKGCATPGRLRAAASKKSEIQQFQIDNQILNVNQTAIVQEPTQGDESDDGFTSVSEDNPPDFMEKNYDFTANFLPNEKPKNKNRLTLSGKFFTHPTTTFAEEEESKENMTANANQSKNNSQPKKATNWMEEIELAKRKMIEMEAGPTETITTANLFANPTTTKKYGFFDLLETKGTNLTPSKNPLSASVEDAAISTPLKITQTPTRHGSSAAEEIIAEIKTPLKINSVPTAPLAPTTDLIQSAENENLAEVTPTKNCYFNEEVDEKIEAEAAGEEVDQAPRDDDLATTELYINNLKNVFDQSINLYCQLAAREGLANGKERIILGKFQDLFSHMRDELEGVMPSEQKSQEMLLENYSEMLVSLVKSKLG